MKMDQVDPRYVLQKERADPQHPFAVGLTIAEFRAVSTDENWLETFIQDSLKGVHKVGLGRADSCVC